MRRGAALGLVAALAHGIAAAAVVNVSPAGNDARDGASAPVRTIARAQQLARMVRARGADAVEIVLAGGTYELERPITLGRADSGAPGRPLVIRAAPGAAVALSGGQRLHSWQTAPDGEMVTRINLAAFGGQCPAQLYVDGVRRERPRWPVAGTFPVGTVEKPRAGETEHHFLARPGDLAQPIRAADRAEIVILDAWQAPRLPVAGYDPATHRLDLGVGFPGRAGHGFAAGMPYYLENVPGALAPGQWRCDPRAAMIRYRPLAPEKERTLAIVAARLPHLIELQGSRAAPVHDVRIEGIGLGFSGWTMPAAGWSGLQAEVGLTAAIDAAYCEGITLIGLRLHQTGAGGLRIGIGCRNVRVTDSQFDDLGGGGIMIGSGDRRTAAMGGSLLADCVACRTSNILVQHNVLRHLGRIQRAGVGIWQGQADHVVIDDNQISDLYYSGISIGWIWNSTPGVSESNRVTRNVIDSYGQGVLSDMGGIYTLGRQPGTLVADNRISRGRAATYGGWGLYADEGSSGITFARNIVRDTSNEAIFPHEAGEVVFEDNVASGFGGAGLRCSAPRPDTRVTFLRNRLTPAPSWATLPLCKAPNYLFK